MRALTSPSSYQLKRSLDRFLPILISTLEGGQSAVPVAHGEEQDHYRPQDHRGAEGAVHSSKGGCLPVRPHSLLLASLCRGRGCRQSQHIPQEGGSGRNGGEPHIGGQHVHCRTKQHMLLLGICVQPWFWIFYFFIVRLKWVNLVVWTLETFQQAAPNPFPLNCSTGPLLQSPSAWLSVLWVDAAHFNLSWDHFQFRMLLQSHNLLCSKPNRFHMKQVSQSTSFFF